MSDKALFAHYVAFRKVEFSRQLGGTGVASGATGHVSAGEVASELEELFAKREGALQLRGAYSCEGFRPDTDILLWLTSPSVETLQDTYVSLARPLLERP